MNKEEKSVIYEDLVESIKNIYLQGTKRKKKQNKKKLIFNFSKVS